MPQNFDATVKMRKSERERALLLLIRFSLLMLSRRRDDESLVKLKARLSKLEDHLNQYQPSAWFLKEFGNGPVMHRSMLISAVEDANGWHVQPLKGMHVDGELHEEQVA